MIPRTPRALAAAAALALVAVSCDARSSGAASVRRSVVLITIDTLRADRLGCTGHAGARTPRLDALARAGHLYTHAIAPAPLTLPSHATMLSGRLPIEHGARDNKPFRFPAERFDTVAATLRTRGYATVAIVGGEPLARGCGLESDFEIYDDAFARAAPGSLRLGERTAAQVTDAALAALAGVDAARPLFLWAHYFDPHDPYTPPPDLATDFRDAPYDGEIAAVDREVGRLLDGLDAARGAGQLAVVVTADHGESLGEHGEARHGFYVYDATIRVPLIVRAPGLSPQVSAQQVRLQDLRAALEALAAGETPDLGAPARRGEPAFVESLYGQIHCDFAQLRGLRRHDGIKYLESGAEEWFALDADPNETDDLLSRAGAVPTDELARARRALDTILGDATSSGEGGGPAEIGYVGAAPRPETIATRSRAENARALGPRQRAASIHALIEGARLLELGAAEAAVAVLEPAVADDAANPGLLLQLARALRRVADERRSAEVLDRAIACLQRVRSVRPDHAQARDLLLFTQFQRGDYAGARALYDEAVRSGTATASTYEAMARARLDLDEDRRRSFAAAANPLADESAALADLERAVELGATPGVRALLEVLESRYSARGEPLQAERARELRARSTTNAAIGRRQP